LVAQGFLDASIHRICRQAGVGIGTYYSHFKGRQKEVLNTILEAEFARFNAIENKNGTRAQLFELLGGAANEDAVRLRHIWHDVAFYRGPVAPDVEALWWKQITHITGLIREIRKLERIVDPALSAREVAWLILLLMRDRDTFRLQGQDNARGFVKHLVNAAIGVGAPTGSRPAITSVATKTVRSTRRKARLGSP